MTAVRPINRVVECGLEVPRGVVYQGWEPGGEYTKPLVVRNVQLRTQRIKYTIKGNQFHSAIYPRPIVLSAGMSYTLPIVFKPRKKEACEECIELETAEGAVEISLKAVLPCVTVTLPDSLKFGLCAVQDSISLDFHISNTSYVGTHFSFECPNECFTISPNTGELPPKASHKLSATFTPSSARVYSAEAVCSYVKEGGGEKKSVVKLRGVGKYPHVVVRLPCGSRNRVQRRKGTQRSKKGRTPFVEGNLEELEESLIGVGSSRVEREVTVEFGSVAVGTSTQKWIELVNISAVTASVSILPTNQSRLNPAHFTCPPSPPPLLPHSTHRLPLTFSPTLPSQHSTFAFFQVKTHGGLATTTIKCIGAAKAPRVCIEEKVLSFGNVPCGQSVTSLLHVSNNSDVTALFQLQLERCSVFSVESTCIKLPPNTSHKIPLRFTPRKPAPHFRTIACLAQHQEPLFVSLIGTAYSETITPVVLQPQNVLDYLSNAQSGITKLPPERAVELMKDGKLVVDANTGLLVNTDDSDHPTQGTIGEAPTLLFTNYLHSPYEPSGIAHVSIDSQDIQFGCVSPHSVSDGQSLHVTNHTEGTICCVWMTESGGTFSVTPEEREIAPGTTCLFTAHFKPKRSGEFYFEELECYAFYKCLQSFQSVPAAASVAVTPPWCLCVRAQGHSFSSNTHTFTPKLVFETRDVVFPASSPLEPVYRSMTVWNDGDTPALFEMSPDPNKVFTIRPLSGLISPGQYQTFVMEMMPQEAKTYKRITRCALNASSDYNEELFLSGTAEMSPILLENQGRLFFKPTCVRANSSTNLRITNTAQVPLRYEWRVSGNGPEVFTVEPCEGEILPSESQTHEWQFSPLEAGSLASRAVLYTTVVRDGSSSHNKRRHKSLLELFGQGIIGDIQCHPSRLQFGTVVMGTSHTHTITLHNPSLCTLNYSLHVHLTSTNGGQHLLPHQEEKLGTTSHGVKLDRCEGMLHARSSQVVRVTVRPAMTTPYCCVISYHLVSSNQAVADPTTSVLCELEITGSYPSLVVTDVHGIQVANGLSKAHLWKMLSIDRLNSHLQEEPCSSELRYAIGTRHSMRRRVSVHTHSIEDFQFGAAPLDSGCSVVHLVLENRGKVDSQWGFQFPSDMHLEPEYWADSGVLDEVERHQHDIIANQLFTVSPKTGTLAPGERVSVLCSFKHTHIGRSKLPVLLKIHRGREILLNWSGVTVEHDTPHVFFTSHHHFFHPVPIGTTSYPAQTYELHNVGERSVTYTVDTAPLEALRGSNYNMPVLQCLCAQGEVPAQGTAALPFIFSPLEAKKYSVDVPISFSTGESVLITFSGEGLDPNTHSTDPDTQCSQLPVTGPPVTLPDQLAVLSSEHLSLGPAPIFSPVRRLVFLSNLHPSHSISYTWCISPTTTVAQVVSIHPSEGCVLPGKSCVCRVTFYSQFSPSVYDLDIICKVVDKDRMSEYQCKLVQWTKQQEENKHMFTISHPKPAQNFNTDETEEVSTSCLRSSSHCDLRGSRYQVLPPIGANSLDVSYEDWKKLDLSIRSKTRPRAQKSCGDEPPCPPPPFLLHLGITANTHSLSDYADTFGDLDTFYISPPHQCSPQVEGDSLCMKTEERDLLLSVLGQITRELLNDSNFHSAIERVQQEPVPYFTQFSAPPHTAAMSSSSHIHVAAATVTHTDHSGPMASSRALSDSEVAAKRSEAAAEEKEDDLVSRDRAVSSVGSAQLGGESCVASEDKSRSSNFNSSGNIIERSPEVESLMESILENTLLNIVREGSGGGFNITAPHYLVTQHNQ